MTVSSVYSSVNTAATTDTSSKTGTGFGSMGATDFLKLLTEQMKMQDPTAPVDNKDMLAQMASFSNLSNSAEMNSTLKAIAAKLDLLTAPATGDATTDTSGTTDGATAV